MSIAAQNSYKTAIVRKKVSRPTQYLITHNLIRGRVLDYGCGRGFDAITLGFDKFDPHFFPEKEFEGKRYDTVVCNFVLNTLERKDREKVLTIIKSLLNVGGIAYVSVRRDIKKDGYTRSGTYQETVILPNDVVTENSDYCLYKIT